MKKPKLTSPPTPAVQPVSQPLSLADADTAVNPVAIRGDIPQPTTYFPTRFDLDGRLFRIGTNFPLN